MNVRYAMAICVALALALVACEKRDPDLINGYVEVEPVRVAAPLAGRLVKLSVQRGDEVAVGRPLFVLDTDREVAAVAQAQAQVSKAEAQQADLSKGKRRDELAAIDAGIAAARAALRQSEADLARQQKLADAQFVSPNALSALTAKRDADAAQVRQLEADLRSARLAARDDERDAAAAEARATRAALAQSQWSVDQKSLKSPVAARVEDTLYREGEWVNAGSPIVSLLAPDGIKLRFFVPEVMLPRVKAGARVQVTCDGCDGAIPATIRYIAREAEFTPPVIYSRENRERLVFLVEAWPSVADAARLHPGQPVEVRLGAAQ
ncbi:HlyD family efflux transporter periplasmic adaptor subunit [Uliginosibacterium sp. H3]|uniref:HlyD family efflux transporter periplasmic adaptor subunit n=1 Tax=Uliginosibacterium silvisoli TaxID=3114758 RepID=A0ABU6JZ76_9RHOO|nr:HlyD family efflux transporter periplasmic adaptor subunit [Uliginosibacterium sp. H3]